jgi:hypothetical protein
MKPDPIQTAHTERERCPLMLEPPELALDGSARAVELCATAGFRGGCPVRRGFS